MNKDRIKKIIGDVEFPVIFEIGANNGSDTVDFLRVMPNASLHCFEPDPRAYAALKSQGYPVVLNNCAICDCDGTVVMHLSGGTRPCDGKAPEWNLSSSIRKPTGHLELHPWCKFEKDVSVAAIRLDTYCGDRNIDTIDFMWADVQGAELDMIAGGTKTFSDSVRYLYTEYSNTELYEGQPALQQILDKLSGYVVVEDFGGDVLLKNEL